MSNTFNEYEYLNLCLNTLSSNSLILNSFLYLIFILSLSLYVRSRCGLNSETLPSFLTLYILRNNTDFGLPTIILILIICISTDTGGYVFGKTFKGPKIIKISPNKTYSGMFGSFLFSIIFISLFLNYNNTYIIDSAKIISLMDFMFIIFISSISQIGDIFVSFFKRKSKIKNTGKLIPGHGGILDRIDGMIFAFPASYLILNTIS